MISIVLYGRNDNYGYNLHKRAALSLNCMAEVLTDPSDEIIFVDYNTPDDFPTFPEAIQDTLTERARQKLRIFRVRPRIHQRFASMSHLLALEPIARNIAVRRSSPSNKWILSTNTDIILIPLGTESLSEVARDLTPGFYHAPRIEIPEMLWESFDRHAPGEIIRTVRDWGATLHLNEIVLGSKFIRYDGPGDFQLFLRSDLFENQGFNASMLLGWHVDSNIAARMLLKYEEVGDLGKHVYGYHCDHTRQVTPAHSHSRVENDWRRFVDDVTRPDLPEQATNWGCPDDAIEEIRLASDTASVYVEALKRIIGDPLKAPNIVKYTAETYNEVDYDPRHLLPFLADMFVSMPRDSNLAWYGARPETLTLFATAWSDIKFTGKIFIDDCLREGCLPQLAMDNVIRSAGTPEILAGANAFVFDFGGQRFSLSPRDRSAEVNRKLIASFRGLVKEERRRVSVGLGLRRVIALNAINNEYEALICSCVAAAATPFATHMRHGFVLPPLQKEDWTRLLRIGEAGIRLGDGVCSQPTKQGWVAYGPYRYLEKGAYVLSLNLERIDGERLDENRPCAIVEVRAGARLVAAHVLRSNDIESTNCKFRFVISQTAEDQLAGIETRIGVPSPIGILFRSLTIESLADPVDAEESAAALDVQNWLPFLRLGPKARADGSAIWVNTGQAGFVLYGPYWSLPAGRYEMVAHFECDHAMSPEHLLKVDVAAGNQVLTAGNFHFDRGDLSAQVFVRLPFSLDDEIAKVGLIETRIWSSGEQEFKITSVSVRPCEKRESEDLYPYLLAGEAGSRVTAELRGSATEVGFVAYSRSIKVEPGVYRAGFQITIHNLNQGFAGKDQTCAVLFVKQEQNIIATAAVRLEEADFDQDLVFEVASASAVSIEFLVKATGIATIGLRRLELEVAKAGVRATLDAVFRVENWLPFLLRGPNTRAEGSAIRANAGASGFVVYGPYWSLPAGRYEMVAHFECDHAMSPEHLLKVDVAAGNQVLTAGNFHFDRGDLSAQVFVRLPFSLDDEIAKVGLIETRIWSSGEQEFKITSVSVRPCEKRESEDLYPYLLAGEAGSRVTAELRGSATEVGFVAYSRSIKVEPGVYRAGFQITIHNLNQGFAGKDQTCAVLFVKQEQNIIATAAVRLEEADFDQDLVFEVASASAVSIEFLVKATGIATIGLRRLELEVAKAGVRATLDTVFRVENWLPFLLRGTTAQLDGAGILVRQGRAEWAVYGPYWTLPHGRYEMIASIVPTPTSDGKPVIEVDVTAEIGTHQLAAARWRLDQFQLGDGQRAAELRLPFTLADNLPPELRTIETRIYTPGDGNFRIRSLVVRIRRDDLEGDWFPYLIAGECAVHAGNQIKIIGNAIGCLAYTPRLEIEAGHYELLLKIENLSTNYADLSNKTAIVVELSAGSEVIMTKSVFLSDLNADGDALIDFYVGEEVATGIALFIGINTPATVSIRGLGIKKHQIGSQQIDAFSSGEKSVCLVPKRSSVRSMNSNTQVGELPSNARTLGTKMVEKLRHVFERIKAVR